MESYDVIVIGQGFAGLTAAKLCAEKGLRTANFEAEMFGGLIVNINELDPGPGGEHGSGVDLASNLAMANMETGIESVSEPVESIARAGNGLVVNGNYSAPQVIIATGARHAALGIPGEDEFVGRGVSHCADCDGPMFMGKDAVLVGGGDSACQEALALAQYASKVTMVYRGAALKGRADLVARVNAEAKIAQIANATPVAITGGSSGVEAVRISHGGAEQSIPCAGVFIFAGLTPNSECAPAEVARDAGGALVVDARCATSVPGLWAIGAVRAGYGGTLDDAAADAAAVVAAL